jgi:hypothetical protein
MRYEFTKKARLQPAYEAFGSLQGCILEESPQGDTTNFMEQSRHADVTNFVEE